MMDGPLDDGGAPNGAAFETEIRQWADHYFLRTKEIISRFGDKRATYAVFMRRPVVFAPRLALEWLDRAARSRGADFEIEVNFEEGAWVGAGEPLIYVSGLLSHQIDLETLLLQKLGAACVAANNAYVMCATLPGPVFMAMDARHCAGTEMADQMDYAAAVG